MTDTDQHLLVFTTHPDREGAEALARQLIETGLAACVNILPEITSVYRWEGDLEQGREHLILIKTRRDLYRDLEEGIRSLHPYELPEIIGVPIACGLQPYLNWVDQCTEK